MGFDIYAMDYTTRSAVGLRCSIGVMLQPNFTEDGGSVGGLGIVSCL